MKNLTLNAVFNIYTEIFFAKCSDATFSENDFHSAKCILVTWSKCFAFFLQELRLVQISTQ